MVKFYCEETDEIFSYDSVVFNERIAKCMTDNNYLVNKNSKHILYLKLKK